MNDNVMTAFFATVIIGLVALIPATIYKQYQENRVYEAKKAAIEAERLEHERKFEACKKEYVNIVADEKSLNTLCYFKIS